MTISRCTLASLRPFSAVLFAALTSTMLVSAAAPPPAATAHLMAPADLRCDHQSEPLAVADAEPGFSWMLKASAPTLHSVSQSAYEIQVAGSAQDLAAAPLWDSGIVHAGAASGIPFAGPALLPQHLYVWRVRVWDEHDRPSAWSQIAHWTQAPEWRPTWIGASTENSATDTEPLPIFRKSLALNSPVKRALLYASGLGQDEVRPQWTQGWRG